MFKSTKQTISGTSKNVTNYFSRNFSKLLNSKAKKITAGVVLGTLVFGSALLFTPYGKDAMNSSTAAKEKESKKKESAHVFGVNTAKYEKVYLDSNTYILQTKSGVGALGFPSKDKTSNDVVSTPVGIPKIFYEPKIAGAIRVPVEPIKKSVPSSTKKSGYTRISNRSNSESSEQTSEKIIFPDLRDLERAPSVTPKKQIEAVTIEPVKPIKVDQNKVYEETFLPEPKKIKEPSLLRSKKIKF